MWELLYLATTTGLVTLGTFLEVKAQARVTLLGHAATVLACICGGVTGVQSALSLMSLDQPTGVPALAKVAGVYVVAWFFVLTIWPSPLLTERTPNCDE